MNYTVSAVVSTYNSESFIRGCLQDLENQTVADDIEIIVVDSGSSQDEASVVKAFQQEYSNIIYIRTQQRETVYQAWNRGIKMARGKYITNANTDDRHKPDALEKMAAFLEENKEIDLVYGWQWISNVANEGYAGFIPLDVERWPPEVRGEMMNFIGKKIIKPVDRKGKRGYYIQWPHFSKKGLEIKNIAGPQPMWRKGVHDRIGYFDEAYEIGGDYEFWLRMVNSSMELALVPEILGVFYLGGLNKEFTDQLQLWKERLWRARKYLAHIHGYHGYLADIYYHLLVIEPGNENYHREIEKLYPVDLPNLPVYRIASFYKRQKDDEKALRWFSKIDRTSADEPMLAGLHFHMGEIELFQEQFGAAHRSFTRTIELNPGHRKAVEYLRQLDHFKE